MARRNGIEVVDTVRRGGTIFIIGLYGGMADPLLILALFDRQIQLRMGQANLKHWTDDIMPLLVDGSDPLGVEDLKTHELPLDAPHAYEIFQKKEDGASKILLNPSLSTLRLTQPLVSASAFQVVPCSP